MNRRAFATFLVLWAVLIAAAVLITIQVVASRQSADARREVARIRAYWAARAGLEAQIAALTNDTLNPDSSSAFATQDALAAVALSELDQARYEIFHDDPTKRLDGPADTHALININTATKTDLLLLPDMDDATADAILDWIDADDQPRELGAEIGTYQGFKYPYVPRDSPIRSIRELELIVGVKPEYVRSEDWNLNGILDPNEDDGDASWPPDNADGVLDRGWSGIFTAESSFGPGWAMSGQPRLNLLEAQISDLVSRLKVDEVQARAVLAAVQRNASLTLKDFIQTDLGQLALGGAGATLLTGQSPGIPNLNRDQLKSFLDETWIGDPNAPLSVNRVNAGRININTVDKNTLEYVSSLSPAIADSIILQRDSRSGGFVSLADLLDVPAISNSVLASLYDRFDVRSQTYTLTSRGYDVGVGLRVEIHAVIDRSTLPVRIMRLSVH